MRECGIAAKRGAVLKGERVKEGFYTFDLIEEVVADPRIADADLDLIAYKNSIGPDSWSSLLRRYAHDEE